VCGDDPGVKIAVGAMLGQLAGDLALGASDPDEAGINPQGVGADAVLDSGKIKLADADAPTPSRVSGQHPTRAGGESPSAVGGLSTVRN
jgi:hypothetical protein